MRDSSLRRAGALCSHLWQEQEACIPHVNISGMPGLAFIKYMVTRDICMRLCAACQYEALATAILSSRDLSDISAQKDEHTDGQCCV